MATIKLEDNVANIVLKAITDRMNTLNSIKSISGVLSDSMEEDYECLEEAFNAVMNGLGKEEKIYVVSVDDIPEDKLFSELTDDEVIELSKKSYSVKGFLLDFNGDYLDPSSEFTRLIIK